MSPKRNKPLGAEARREYVAQAGPRYRGADRAGKRTLLDEFCAACGYERKYAIKLLKGRRPHKRAHARRGAPARYGAAHLSALKAIWLKSQQPCSKRLKALLAQWLPFYERRAALEPAVREELLAMSPSTMDRLLKPARLRAGRGRRPSPPGTLLRTEIPIRTRWEEAAGGPGWIEADTVAHGGGSMAGDFVWSLTLTDIHSGWTELAAVWNRGGEGMVAAIRAIEQRLVFPILGFDCDNGSEFLNHHLLRHFAGRRGSVKLTRSRPYMSNDNAHVEQKQWTHVRQLLGYDRLGEAALVQLIERLYRPWCLLHNFFLPSVKLERSWREGAKVRRRHGPPMTPCDRLLASPALAEQAKERLRQTRERLDPFALDRQIEAALKPIMQWRRAQRAAKPGAPPPDPRSLTPQGPSEWPKEKGPTPSKPAPSHHSARSPPGRSGRSPAEPCPPGGQLQTNCERNEHASTEEKSSSSNDGFLIYARCPEL